MLLLAIWFGPVSLDQTVPLLRGAVAPAGAAVGTIAEESMVPAGKGLILAPGTPIVLHLRDGSVVNGRFLGRSLQDSAAYAVRFAASAPDSGAGGLALGDTLRVVTLDGRESVAAFAGWAEMALLLRDSPDSLVLHVPFEFARSIARADSSPVDIKVLKREFRSGALPSADVLVLGARDPVGSYEEQWASALRVPADDIETVSVPASASSDSKGMTGLIVLALGVTAFVMIIVATHRDSPQPTGCQDVPVPSMSGWGSAVPTNRPFDLNRGRFVDDPVTQAEVWSEAPPLAAR